MRFEATAGEGAAVSANGSEIIQVDKLDNIISGGVVTFIKLDIEGSELNALRGVKMLL